MKQREEIQVEIEGLQKKIAELDNELVAMRPEVFKELSALTRTWIEEEVRRTIEKNPRVAGTLDQDKLRGLKGKVAGLVTDIQVWLTQNRFFPQTPGEDYLDTAYRSMAGRLGNVLAEYGFINVHADDCRWKRIVGEWAFDGGPYLQNLVKPAITKARKVQESKSESERMLKAAQTRLEGVKAREAYESA